MVLTITSLFFPSRESRSKLLVGEHGGQLNVSTVPVFVFLMNYIYLHPPSSLRSGKNSEQTEIHANRLVAVVG